MHLQQSAFDQQLQRIPHQPFAKGEGLEAFLVQEVRTVAVAVQIRCRNQLQVRFLELVARLESLFKDRAGKQVAHLQAHQRLTAASRGRVYFDLETGIGDIFKLEDSLALDADRVHQCGHKLLIFLSSIKCPINSWTDCPFPYPANDYLTYHGVFGGNTMKFLCMVLVDEKKLHALSESELQALDDESLAFDDT